MSPVGATFLAREGASCAYPGDKIPLPATTSTPTVEVLSESTGIKGRRRCSHPVCGSCIQQVGVCLSFRANGKVSLFVCLANGAVAAIQLTTWPYQ